MPSRWSKPLRLLGILFYTLPAHMDMTVDFAALLDELTVTTNRIVGQIVSVRPNDKGGTGFILARNAEHRRYLFLGRDCPNGVLPEVGTLVSFESGQQTGRYPRARNIEILATAVQKTDNK
jgi:hypothetical protein